MNRAAHAHPITGAPYPHLGINGCGSSGKTQFCAMYSIIHWLCSPLETLVLVTSTDLKAARKRIWGAIKDLWQAVPGLGGNAVVLDAYCSIIPVDAAGNKLSERSGIALIAGEKKKEKDAIGKIIGSKNKRVFMIADELPELTEAIPEAAFSNLVTNPFFQFIGIGNFKNRYDPFGVFVRPKAGWESISVEDDGWETDRGWCLHFDGLRSPNILAGKEEWPIYGSKQLAAHRKDLGENTAGFWRMCRSFETPISNDNAIYTEPDFIAGKAYEKVLWLTTPISLSSLDPSYTQGGDRCAQWIASFGQTKDLSLVLQFERLLLLRENVLIRDKDRHRQIAEQFRDNCKTHGVLPENAALDATAAGSVLHSLLAECWSDKVLKVDFSGQPSDLPISAVDPKRACDAYDRRVSELWYIGKEFLRFGQLKGIPDDLAREMKARTFDTVKSADGLKMRVETKKEMKVRIGYSPDLADSAFVLIDLARVRHGFVPRGKIGVQRSTKPWQEAALEYDSIYVGMYEEPLKVA
jgi:hypothetical protein